MRKPIPIGGILALLFLFLCYSCESADQRQASEVVTDFNFDWKFARGASPGAEQPGFDDASWREIRLPHDWSIEEPFTQDNTGGATAFLPGGIGWYRKTFKLPKEAADKTVRINFDGIYNNSEVWINGHVLSGRPYGYSAFYYDLTPYLKFGDSENIIAVRADRTAFIDSRWYPGSGIYRNVRLETIDKLHIEAWGTFITTPEVSVQAATVMVLNNLKNNYDQAKEALVKVIIQNTEGKMVASAEKKVHLEAGEAGTVSQSLNIAQPQLWATETPGLYTAITTISEGDRLLNSYEQNFGIRSIKYDAQKGFFLNGKKTRFKGVCLHHDGGLVGAAVPIGVWKRRLQRLKDAGVNAIRTAHNPPAEDFLDLCDRMGFLVFEEIFDEWDNPKDKRHNYNQQEVEEVTKGYTEHFHDWAERDVKSMVTRDRNHPSIVAWSIGNEIEWTYSSYKDAAGYWSKDKPESVSYYYDEPFPTITQLKERFRKAKPDNYELAATAKRLSTWTKQLDTTRPVTANLVIPSISYHSGYTDALDVVGLSYRQSVYDYVASNYPEKMILGSENWAQWHEWKAVLENENIQGVFLWTGVDYMGESRGWPIKGSSSGLLDFAGFTKPSYNLFKTLWQEKPHVYLSTVSLEESKYELVDNKVLAKKRNEKYIPMWGWSAYEEHWNYREGESVVVEVITNCPTLELFLNGESLGTQTLAENYDDKIMQWHVPFTAGKLTAVGTSADGSNTTYELQTAGEVAAIRIESDKETLNADGYDVAHIELQLTDAKGIPVTTDDREVVFDLQGNYRLLGVDNGDRENLQTIQTNRIVTKNGRCLLILQSIREAGEISVSATSRKANSETILIYSK